MSSEFVRYVSEIETIDPHIGELLAQIVDFVEKKGRESPRTEGTGRAGRAAHAKSFGPGQVRRRDAGGSAGGVCAGHLRQAGPPLLTAPPSAPTGCRRKPNHSRSRFIYVARATCITLTSEDVDSRRTL